MATEKKREKEKRKKKNYLKDALQKWERKKSKKKKSTQLLRTPAWKKSLKKAHSEERREPSNTLNKTLNKNWVKNDHTKERAGSCFSFTFCLCRGVGLHTCHSVSPLLSLSSWSGHLPQCQSTSVSVALVSTLADGIVKIHVHISFHRGWTRIFRWTLVSSH